jgi:hypothetical protein
MKAATIQQIKEELATVKPAQLTALCLRLAKFKKENKELLTYLLFEAGDEAGYLQSVKNEVEAQFTTINTSSAYFVKKSLRKIIRLINRYTGFSDEASTSIELRIYFCTLYGQYNMAAYKNKMLDNIYDGQVKKINALIKSLHEDLQYDYGRQVKALGNTNKA